MKKYLSVAYSQLLSPVLGPESGPKSRRASLNRKECAESMIIPLLKYCQSGDENLCCLTEFVLAWPHSKGRKDWTSTNRTNTRYSAVCVITRLFNWRSPKSGLSASFTTKAFNFYSSYLSSVPDAFLPSRKQSILVRLQIGSQP